MNAAETLAPARTMLTPRIIAWELHRLCGEPTGPLQIIRRYDIADDKFYFSFWASGRWIIAESFGSNELTQSLEQFSREFLLPIAEQWIDGRGTKMPYAPLPQGVGFCYELHDGKKEKKMNVRLLGDLLLIKRAAPVTQIGSIVLAESAVEELSEGEIVAVGPGKICKSADGKLWLRPMSVVAGERVLFSKHGHSPVKIEGEEFVTLREDSIVAVYDKREPMTGLPGDPTYPDAWLTATVLTATVTDGNGKQTTHNLPERLAKRLSAGVVHLSADDIHALTHRS